MTTRVRDVDGAREIQLDATSRDGSVFISGKGFCLEFDRGILEQALRKELGLDVVISSGDLLGDGVVTPTDVVDLAPPAQGGLRV